MKNLINLSLMMMGGLPEFEIPKTKLEYWPNLGRYLPTNQKGRPQNYPMVTSKAQARKLGLI